jgi:hypothetical protein
VNTAAARYQNLSINQAKLSGQCGRLKCCLNYELDTYLDALQHFPDNCDTIQVTKGNAYLIKKDIFKNLMWYGLPESSKQYPLTIARVLEIKSQNQKGITPDELQPVELTSSKPKEVEPEFVDVVGQISLRSLERADKKKKQQQRAQQQGTRNKEQGTRDRGQGGRNREQDAKDRGHQPRNQQPRGPQQKGQPQKGQSNRPPQKNQGNRPPDQQRPNRPGDKK